MGHCEPSYRYSQVRRTILAHRVTVSYSDECSSASEVVDIDTKRLTPLAKKLNLSVTSFGKHITDPSVPHYGTVNLSNSLEFELDPAPVSPYRDSVAFSLLSGTIKAVYSAHRGLVDPGGGAIKVYPTYSSGNTGKPTSPWVPRGIRGPIHSLDTANYWKLSKNIYRYNHKNGLDESIPSNVHTINESEYIQIRVLEVWGWTAILDILVDTLLEMVKFFTTFILNADEALDL